MQRVILSTSLIIGEGTFEAKAISQDEAQAWLDEGPFTNYYGHETVRILGLKPDRSRQSCVGYDEALTLKPNDRLEFGREYSREEIERIGVEFVLIRRIPTIDNILALAAKLPSGLNDPRSANKLLAELDELLVSVFDSDEVGALTEAADAAYYAAKHLDFVANLLNISVEDVLNLAIAKYKLRAKTGNPKNDVAEREAVLKALKK